MKKLKLVFFTLLFILGMYMVKEETTTIILSEANKLELSLNNITYYNYLEESNLISYTIDLIKDEKYKKENLERYISYYENNNELSLEDIIMNVNVGIDNSFYTNIKEIEDPSALLVLVNKYNKLPSTYIPETLTQINSQFSSGYHEVKKEVAEAFETMCEEAITKGLYLYAVSSYRSYSTQSMLYNNYVAQRGKTEADTFSARPGHSEHQTGLAVDVNTASRYANFGDTEEGTWLAEHCHEYGFIIRYEESKEYITGYRYEPWHIRYIGIEAATIIYENSLTLEEYLLN